MNTDLPSYNGKPTVYLDQNVLSLLIAENCQEFKESLIRDFQVVYSNETLSEIKRSKEGADNFLKLLYELNAVYINVILEQPYFKNTGIASLSYIDPFEKFEDYCKSEDQNTTMLDAMKQWQFKLAGGRKGDDIEKILNEQIDAFDIHMMKLRESVSELNPEHSEIINNLRIIEDQLRTQLLSALEQTKKILKEQIGNGKNWSSIENFRSTTGLGPRELNNLKPPKIINKIIEIINSTSVFNENNLHIENLINASLKSATPDGNVFQYQKVQGLYNLLNTIGYFPDSNVQKERRFIASLSDNTHASMASFCDFLLSIDEAFVKKTQAVYEYLGIDTIVKQVIVNRIEHPDSNELKN